MAYRASLQAVAIAAGLVASGVIADTAWRDGRWGSFAGAVLTAIWLASVSGHAMARRAPPMSPSAERRRDSASDGLLLDAAPTPMLVIADGTARALNRAARRLFATDDRILPAPTALFEPDIGHLRHEGRHWRIDRVMLGDEGARRVVLALVDIAQEERTAEARATADMIHVLGHELLNGLAPIVSLAESGEAVLAASDGDADTALLREILGTLARRAETLQRFTSGYRDLARLPVPRRAFVAVAPMVADLARLFTGHWPDAHLTVEVQPGAEWPIDRDQTGQALWALLQNAAEAAISARGAAALVALVVTYDGGDLVISVEDNGAGVSSDAAARIFRPFHTTKPGGTGIGLSLARQIAHGHGGELSLVRETPATFVMRLPKGDG